MNISERNNISGSLVSIRNRNTYHLPRITHHLKFLVALVFLALAASVWGEIVVLQVAGTGIIVKTVPPSAKVYVDGAERGLTPLKLPKLRPGIHSLRIKKDYHEEFSRQIMVPADGCLEISVDLMPVVRASQPVYHPIETKTEIETIGDATN